MVQLIQLHWKGVQLNSQDDFHDVMRTFRSIGWINWDEEIGRFEIVDVDKRLFFAMPGDWILANTIKGAETLHVSTHEQVKLMFRENTIIGE